MSRAVGTQSVLFFREDCSPGARIFHFFNNVCWAHRSPAGARATRNSRQSQSHVSDALNARRKAK
jgi:hypothetical protein